tara:strand:- start:12 stop:377 length:366 start_codon:yes stop_codon:yes gene_type:complete
MVPDCRRYRRGRNRLASGVARVTRGNQPEACLVYSGDICEQFYEAARDAITLAPVFIAFIDPAHRVVLNHEHSEYRWVGFDEAVEMVAFGGQRRVLRWVEDEFVERTPSEHLLIRTVTTPK